MKDLRKNFLQLFRRLLGVSLLILTVCAFFWKFVFRGLIPLPGDFVVGVYHPWLDYKWGYPAGVPVKNPITTDVVSFTYPMQMLAVDLLKEGKLPLWNPYILTGTPLLANFQSAPFSPVNFLYFFLDKLTAWSLQIILQHFFAAFFTYLLLRHWKVSVWGASLGGIIFAFSGFNLIWSQWNGHALSAAFIPLILLFEDRWFSGGSWKDGLAISLSFALLFLSGYPQVAIYLFLAVIILWLLRIRERKDWFKKTSLLVIFFLLGAALAAFQILPGAELLLHSQRALEPHPFEWAFLPLVKIITFFAPDYFGNHATQNYWGPQDYTSNTGFVGVVASVLATLGSGLFRKKKEVFYSLVVMAAALLLAFPTTISVNLWKSGIFGLNAASAHRSLVLFNLSVAFLAGFGIDVLIKAGRNIKLLKSIAIPSVVILGFGAYTLVLFFLSKQDPVNFPAYDRWIPKYIVALRNLVFPSAVLIVTSTILILVQKYKRYSRFFTSVLFLLLVFEVFRFGWKFTPFSDRSLVFPTTPALEFLMKQERPFRITASKVTPMNLLMPYKLESLEGYDAVYPLRISQFLASLNAGEVGATPLGRYGTVDNDTSHLLGLLNTKFYLTLKRNSKGDPDIDGRIPERFSNKKFEVAFGDKTTVVLESASALPRAFMVYEWEEIGGADNILDKLLDPNFPQGQKVILEEKPSIKKAGQIKQVAQVEYKKYSENESLIAVRTPEDGLLFVSDSWFPGWEAYVDGLKQRIYRANFAFRAVPIPMGKHEVRFVYRPKSFYNGSIISLTSLLLLAVSAPICMKLFKNEKK